MVVEVTEIGFKVPNREPRITFIKFSIGRVIIVDKIKVKMRNNKLPTTPDTMIAVRRTDIPSVV
jgi:hypothetical protein